MLCRLGFAGRLIFLIMILPTLHTRRKEVNIYIALLYRLLIVLLLLFGSRFIFYAFNAAYFPGLNVNRWLNILTGGLRFDVVALCYINIIYILMQVIPLPVRFNKLYQKIAKGIFIVSNSLALMINSIDFIYFRFTLRRSTLSVLDEFANETDKLSFFSRFIIDYWYVGLVFILLIWLSVKLYNLVSIKKDIINKPAVYYTKAVIIMLVSVHFVMSGIRGNWNYSARPITIAIAGEYVSTPEEIPLVLNTPFTVIRESRRSSYKKETFYAASEADAIFNPVQTLSSSQNFKYDNVVIIVLESFGKDAVGFYNKDLENGQYKGFTPFLDSLIGISYSSRNSFANGRKSIDALPSIMAGIPAGESHFVLTPYVSNNIKSLPDILAEKGYHNSFFHGAPNGSMGFKAIMQLLGVNKYFGMTEYNNRKDYDGHWGIWDESFLQFFARTIDTFPQPFFSTLFTVSSHEPYSIPKEYTDSFPNGASPIYQSVAYTDMALRKFFATASTRPWYKKTLFVITADHSSITGFPEYKTAIGNQSIPILFYHPGDTTLRKTVDRIVEQTDIMPSVLAYLNYSGKVFSFGKNIFDSSCNNFAASYINAFRWVEDNYVLEFNNNHTVGLYNYINDRLMLHNLKDSTFPKKAEMEKKIKAFIQQYHNRLLEDRVYAK